MRGMGVAGWAVMLGCLSGALASSFLTDFGRSLETELEKVMETVHVDYYEAVIITNYTSNDYFDMRAMGPLYNSTKMVIDFIAHKQAVPEGIVTVEDQHLNLAEPLTDHWRVLLAHYAGPVSYLTVTLLLAAALPLAGLFWCCCQWCRSNRRRRPFDRKYDACKKGILAIVLIALLTLFLFGVVCTFATEEQLEQSMDSAPRSLKESSDDVRQFLNATAAHAHWVLVVNYQQLEEKLKALLDQSGMKISELLSGLSHAESVTSLSRIVDKVEGVKTSLARVQSLVTRLRTNAEKLNNNLRRVKKDLLTTLSRCNQPQCRRLQEKYKINQLGTDIDYSREFDQYFPTIPDVTPLLVNVTGLLASDIQTDVQRGQQALYNLQRGVRNSLDTHIPDAERVLRETGEKLVNISASITKYCNAESERIASLRDSSAAQVVTEARASFGPPRRIVALSAATITLTITLMVCCGLVCGVCGKRPDAYGSADCCNKGAARKWLMCGSCVMFVGGGALCAVVAVYFLVGVATQRVVCDPLAEPNGNIVFNVLEKLVDLETQMQFSEPSADPLTLEKVLDRCHRNLTVYETFDLHRKYDLEKLKSELEVEIDSRVSRLRATVPSDPVRILTRQAQEKLQRVADTGLAEFDYDKILDSLETNITSLSLDALATQLTVTADEIERRAGFEPLAASLRRAADDLAASHRDVVLNMTADTAELQRLARSLRDSLQFNRTSLREAVNYLLEQCAAAETFLNTRSQDLVHNLTTRFADIVKQSLEEYLDLVVESGKHKVGNCGPLSNAFNATKAVLCTKIMYPVNGYWMSLSWCVLLFVPLLVVISRLTKLYAHLDPYPGPLVEAEYLYDAYADRDNVPLANAYKAEKRSGRARASTAAAVEEAPPRAEPHARRYHDMAPKHWEEGPPRYHTPTEYERPPPYYYPGPADRQ